MNLEMITMVANVISAGAAIVTLYWMFQHGS